MAFTTCPKCGFSNSIQTKVCIACGESLAGAQAAAVAAAIQEAIVKRVTGTPPSAATSSNEPAAKSPYTPEPFDGRGDGLQGLAPNTPIREPAANFKPLKRTIVFGAVAFALVWGWLQFRGKGDVTVLVFPSAVVARPGATVQLQAEVQGSQGSQGSKDTGIVWSIEEGPRGGQVSSKGVSMQGSQVRANAVYVAPQAPGAYHVIASSHADPKRKAVVQITVSRASSVR
ncbi:MAG TPA: hypothetical protein VKZ53_27270 [Candidatus Angelobacter sp.]|nr:hypothetical protein [Candidatus Angelobacter sp.]